MEDWRALPELGKNNELLLRDTSGKPKPGTIVPCLLCGKPYLMPIYVGEPDQICGECYYTFKEAARVVCAKCQVTICRLVPKVLENGYTIQPQSVLHSSACNICEPDLTVSSIIEIEMWERTVREPKIIIPAGIHVKQ